MRDFNKDFAKACKMCLKAKKTNDAKDAWKLVDFMYDQLLTENVKNDIKDSLTDFMDMLKTDLKILKNKDQYPNALVSAPEEIIQNYIDDLNEIIEYHFGK